MGEAKQRRRRAELGENINLVETQQAMERLDATTVGKPVCLTMMGAGVIAGALLDGTLRAKIMARQATGERHLWRYCFMVWDRVRTGEYSPWACTLCGGDYFGLQRLSVLGVIDDPRRGSTPDKPAAMALVCTACDSVSQEETQRRIRQKFGLVKGMDAPERSQ
jgi:hypothetical protein